MKKECENCKYWTAPIGDDDLGECHFNPPVVVESSKKSYYGDGNSYYQDVVGVFPKIYSFDWCGKFEANIEE